MTANLRVAQPQLHPQLARRQFGAAGHDRTRGDQVAVQRQRHPRGLAQRRLERGIAAGVPTGVEIGKAVELTRVMGGVTQQVRYAEIQATPSREHFLANGAVMGVGIILGMLLGEIDADLHRPAGVHRVEPTEQALAQRHAGDDLVEQRAQLLLAAHLAQALLVGLPVARRGLQCPVDQ
ncbi:hypothetical protein D3C79_671320 [compost metagenome]